MTDDRAGGSALVPVEGRPLRRPQDMFLYYGATLIRMGARGGVRKFHGPPSVNDQATLESVYPGLLAGAASDPSFAGLIGWSVEWARCGFPRIDIGHKLTASLMATSMPREHVADLAIPWAAFAILIPDGLVYAEDAGGALKDFRCAHVLVEGDEIRVLATDDGIGCWSSPVRSLAELGELDAASDAFHATPLDERDKRALQMVDRLVVGVSALLSSPDDARAIAKCFGNAEYRRRASPLPEAWTYRLVRDVSFDARALVRDYVAGGGRSPTVQSHVRGHWRRQHHGSRWSQGAVGR